MRNPTRCSSGLWTLAVCLVLSATTGCDAPRPGGRLPPPAPGPQVKQELAEPTTKSNEVLADPPKKLEKKDPDREFDLGDVCPSFKLPGVDGKDHALDEYKKDVLVIVFTCNHCPIATAYEDRIIQFTKDFGNRADVVAINVNTDDLDRLPQMKERAAEKHFNFPYLYDETQAIAHSLAAYVTPHFFVFNRERKLVYKGAMDDDLSVEDVKATYLADAVNAVVAGRAPATPFTMAQGCEIHYRSKQPDETK